MTSLNGSVQKESLSPTPTNPTTEVWAHIDTLLPSGLDAGPIPPVAETPQGRVIQPGEMYTVIVEKMVTVNGLQVKRRVRQTRRRSKAAPALVFVPAGERAQASPPKDDTWSTAETVASEQTVHENTTVDIVWRIVEVDGNLFRRKVRRVRRKRHSQ